MKLNVALFRGLVALAGALVIAAPVARAQSGIPLDDQEKAGIQRVLQRERQVMEYRSRHSAKPQIYEIEDKTGGLHTAGNVWMHMDNTNYSPGNLWWLYGLNMDPACQWPGSSGIEYLLYSTLVVAGKDKDGIRRNDEFDEIRGQIADYAYTRHAYEGIPGGRREFDDDGDKKIDEDFLNGLDDDADGKIDEDFAAISPDMWSTEMLDYTPEALSDATYSEPHVALGLKVQRTSYSWSTPGGNDFVGVHYDIINATRDAFSGQARDIDSIYVGMFFRTAVGPRVDPSFNSDDLIGAMEVGADGVTKPDDIRNNSVHPERAAHEDSIMHIYYGCDNDGDLGQTPGAGAVMILGASKFPRLGFKSIITSDDIQNDEYGYAPRHMAVHAYREFRSGLPYAQGGRPSTDLEYYDAMSNASKSTTQFPDLDNTGIYRQLASVGPYITLPIDSTLTFDVAFAVGKADYSAKKPFPNSFDQFAEFNAKFGTGAGNQNMLSSCQEAWRAWKGTYQPTLDALNNGFVCDSINSPSRPGTIGRETCILSALGKTGAYHDCRDQEGDERQVNDLHCTWFDLDCDLSTGVCQGGGGLGTTPLTHHQAWVGSAPPVPPAVKIVPGDRSIEVKWNDISQKVEDAGTHKISFKGFRLYRAAGWKRDPSTGLNGPATDLWELLGDWSYPPAANGVLGDIRDYVNFPDSIQVTNPQTHVTSTIEDTASVDPTQVCSPTVQNGLPCRVHKVGYYHYVDKQVLNGFRYFYVVTAYDQTSKPAAQRDSPLDTAQSQETGRAATEQNVVVSRTDCATDVNHIKVVPDPYRFQAAWDLRPSGADPTGTHINFNHLPCGQFTLSIFTVAGDLVRTFHETDAASGATPGGTIEWNLVSRNGQDVKAGIYVYSVESAKYGRHVGRFTLIR